MGNKPITQRDIKDTNTLISYLKTAKLCSAYHYTNLESLFQIYSNKTLRFSRMSKMNDNFEKELFCDNRDFYFCLSKSREDEKKVKESFGMWAMYGNLHTKKSDKPSEIGVKIYFPAAVLKQIKKENPFININSVAYANLIDNYQETKNVKIFVGSKTIDLSSLEKDNCSGFIKDTAWRYENEMRLRIETTTERITDKTKDIKISTKVLSQLKVYPSPIYELDEVEKAFKKRCNGKDIQVNFCENRYRNSLNLRNKD